MRAATANRCVLIAVGAAVTLAAWSVSLARPTDDQQLDQRLDRLDSRLTALERAVGVKTGDFLDTTIVHRLETIETGLQKLVRATGGVPRQTVGGDVRELERRVKLSDQQHSELQRRLETLEHTSRDAANQARELRELRSELGNLHRKLDDIERRVRKLE